MRSNLSVINVYNKKNTKSKVITQLLYGDVFKKLEQSGSWIKIKNNSDNYKGYIKNKKFPSNHKNTHKICVLHSNLYSKANDKNKIYRKLSFGSKIKVTNKKVNFYKFDNLWIKKKDLKKINFKTKDNFKNINKFINVKYKWGGKHFTGIDCSGLIQLFLNFNNKFCPRDAKDQIKYFKSSGEKTMDVAITPNRPDCLGIRGIARDLASSGLGQLKKQPPIKINQKFKSPIKVSIKKEKGQGCGIFGSVYIKNVRNKESPDWLKKRIISLGLKPISAIVDATNYAMFDLNRPLHAYDADKIDQEIIVRNSKKGESFEALDNKKYTLQNNMCAISDKSGVLGLGGIIGGTRSGTEFSTKNILLESAYFFPSPIRKTSKILNIDTDAKYRFERGIDPDSIKSGLELGMCMILDMCGGEASKFSIVGKIKDDRKIIDLESEKFPKVIGFSITSAEIKKILSSLGCLIRMSGKKIKVLPPTWRPDIKEDIDLIEELIRIKGYDKVPLINPEKENIKDALNYKQKLFHFAQRSVASKGYTEAITWSFTDSKTDTLFSELKNEIKLSNPISSDLDVLRSSLYSNLIISAKKNIHRNFEDLMLFEIGPVFKGSKPGEQLTMIGAIKTGKYSRKNWIEKERNFDVFDIKNDALRILNEVGMDGSKIMVSNRTKKWYHPGRSGLLSLGSSNGLELAYFGEIHPFILKKLDLRTDNVLGFEIFLDNIPESRKKIREAKPQFIVSDYQKVVRDFAFVIDEKYSSGAIISLVKKIDKELIKDVKIFDVYQGDNITSGKKSIAFNVILEPKDKTLSDKDIDQVSKKIISTVQETTGATLRS